jgi:hypothetical protein
LAGEDGVAEAKPNTTHGQYQQNLAAAGIDAKAIDTVRASDCHAKPGAKANPPMVRG